MSTEAFPPLPARKSLGELSAIKPTVLIDSREQQPLVFSNLSSTVAALQSGDYSFVGGENLFAVERKSISDLVGCCTGEARQRFERELHRLRGFRFARLLVVGNKVEIEQHRYRSNVPPKSVLGSLSAWEVRFSVPVVWCPNPTEAALMLERWIYYSARELVQATNGLLAGRADKPDHAEIAGA